MTPPPRRNGPPFPVARKSLGQHFLIDPNIVRKIVRLAELQPGETVLEIGPGRGILTEALLEASGLVVAIELDPALCDYLRTTLGSRPNLRSLIWSFERLTHFGCLVFRLVPPDKLLRRA